jgi:hypothetical protein
MKFKIFLKFLIIFYILTNHGNTNNNKYFGTFTYWDSLKQIQKDFYMKGALDSWGYYIWNNALEDEKDLLVSQFRFCISKESKNFQNNMYVLGWEGDDNAASEIFRWVFASCNNLSETDEYKNIFIEKNKPLENVTKEVWYQLSDENKSTYAAGYIDGSLATLKMILENPDAPKDMKDYYQELFNRISKCFEDEGLEKLLPFVIARDVNESYPIAWNVSFSFGAFCRN